MAKSSEFCQFRVCRYHSCLPLDDKYAGNLLPSVFMISMYIEGEGGRTGHREPCGWHISRPQLAS